MPLYQLLPSFSTNNALSVDLAKRTNPIVWPVTQTVWPDSKPLNNFPVASAWRNCSVVKLKAEAQGHSLQVQIKRNKPVSLGLKKINKTKQPTQNKIKTFADVAKSPQCKRGKICKFQHQGSLEQPSTGSQLPSPSLQGLILLSLPWHFCGFPCCFACTLTMPPLHPTHYL